LSPRIKNPSAWRDFTKDYVFITVENPLKPNHFIRPVRASDERLVEASNTGEITVHLYRPKTAYRTDASGVPDFNEDTAVSIFTELKPLRKSPMKVAQPCTKGIGYSGILGTSCPNEPGASGSPEVVNINGQNLLVGMHIQGLSRAEDSFNKKAGGNGFLQSHHFCKDYESVCGQPCLELDEVLNSSK